MNEKSRGNPLSLHRALSRLPAYPAPDRVWAGVEKTLDAEQAASLAPDALEAQCALVRENREAVARDNEAILRRAVRELPQRSPGKDVFEAIPASTAPVRRNQVRAWYWTAGVAASLGLLVTLAWFARTGDAPERVQIAYSQETLYLPGQPGEGDAFRGGEAVLAFVQSHCAAVPACQTPEFKGLLVQYQELEAARRKLEAQIPVHREQPQLVQYLVRVEKQQTEVGKRLIQSLRI